MARDAPPLTRTILLSGKKYSQQDFINVWTFSRKPVREELPKLRSSSGTVQVLQYASRSQPQHHREGPFLLLASPRLGQCEELRTYYSTGSKHPICPLYGSSCTSGSTFESTYESTFVLFESTKVSIFVLPKVFRMYVYVYVYNYCTTISYLSTCTAVHCTVQRCTRIISSSRAVRAVRVHVISRYAFMYHTRTRVCKSVSLKKCVYTFHRVGPELDRSGSTRPLRSTARKFTCSFLPFGQYSYLRLGLGLNHPELLVTQKSTV